ncbi:tRNA pseudouridine(38-40) synthase TruA [Phaeospirillum tilakii]|uniref:tRNA pseudouridine synthase A n=1 Tax=Phaeospirillum tilakii TaxID=741673 RepID=A0ABW5CAG1_9PROT
MARYRLLIEYDGTPFVGWQRQERGVSVQGAIEDAAARFCGAAVTLFAAGRTDAGVHASGQVGHLDLPRPVPADRVRDAINFHLKPLPVSILAAEEVDEDFHARFSATGRAYLYRILPRRAPPALDRHRVWWVPVPLDPDRMAEAAPRLLGHHDFTSFRAACCQAKSPLKTLDRLDVVRVGAEIQVIAEARSFLHHQVRNMVGSLKLVGEGKWSPDDLARALEARDRTKAGPTAPAAGLTLTGVTYG